MRNLAKTLTPEFKLITFVSFIVLILHFLLHSVRILQYSYSIFYLDESFSIGSIITTCIAFSAFVYAGKIALVSTKKSESILYFLYSGVFILFGLEEAFSFRDALNDFIKSNVSFLSDAANFSWVISLGVFVAIFFAFLLYGTLKEKSDVRKFMFLGLICFVLVAVLELIGGRLYGVSDLYLIEVGIEEFLEMIGLAFFVNAFGIKLSTFSKSF